METTKNARASRVWLFCWTIAGLAATFTLLTSHECLAAPKPKRVLLLIDVQRDFWGPQMAAQNPAFAKNIASLLTTCRQQSIEVIHVHSQFSKDRSKRLASFDQIFGDGLLAVVGSVGAEPMPFAAPTKDESVFDKQAFSCFSNEKLAKYLNDQKPDEILVAGLTTDICVLSAAMGAMDRGYVVRLVADCCGAARPEATQFVLARYGFLFKPLNHADLIP